jgi:Putative prokaryotic signal transducing protein
MSQTELVAIETFVNRIDAELASSLLAASGIDVFVSADDAGGGYPGVIGFGVRLLVRAEDAERATTLLSEAAELDPDE